MDIYERNSLAYVGPEMCTKGDFEVLDHKKDPYFSPTQDANGYLKMQQHIPEESCSIATQSLFENAFVRRSLAMDMADVMSFELGERLRRSLIAALTEEVPPGYSAVSLNQLVAADKKFWVKLAGETCGGVKRCGEDERPCDVEGAKLMEGVLLNMMLAPRAVAPSPAQSSGARTPQPAQSSRGKRRRGSNSRRR